MFELDFAGQRLVLTNSVACVLVHCFQQEQTLIQYYVPQHCCVLHIRYYPGKASIANCQLSLWVISDIVLLLLPLIM